jgi:molybdopterin/thiamine biosynthesis adenylyltransferase
VGKEEIERGGATRRWEPSNPNGRGAFRIPNSKLKVGEMDTDRHDRAKRLGWFDLAKVTSVNVTVVGCGALGNEVVKDLVLLGFKNITLVDMDKVVGANLNRCLFFSNNDALKGTLKVKAVKRGAKALSPDVNITVYAKKVEDLREALTKDTDVILGCLDNIAARLHVNAYARKAGLPYIDGATNGLVGKVQVVGPHGPCLECSMNRTHMKTLNLRQSCTGEDVSFFTPRLAAEITTTSIIAAVQVREALKIVHGLKDKVLEGLFFYDGMRNESSILEIEENPKCPHHSKAEGNGLVSTGTPEEVDDLGQG